MIRFTKTDEVDVESYARKLEGTGAITVEERSMTAALNFYRNKEDSLIGLCKRLISCSSGMRYHTLDKGDVINFLYECERVPAKYFNGTSLEAKILERMAAAGYASDFLEAFIEKNSVSAKNSRTKLTIERLAYTGLKNRAGNEIYHLGYAVAERENRRFYYNNTDLIGIAKEYHKSFSARDGYCLVWGDLKQADLRLAYNLLILDDRNADIMSSCPDSYEGIYKIVCLHFEDEYDPEWFVENRDPMKVEILATVYGQESASVSSLNPFVQKFRQYLSTCPRYVSFMERIDKRIELGLPMIVTSYFGHMQQIAKPSDRDTKNRVLNTPAQTGTSEVIILITNTIIDMFESLGFGEDCVRVYTSRHDEIVFEMRVDILEHSWVLEQCRRVLIDDMTEIGMGFQFGYYYKDIDGPLTAAHKKSIELNQDKIDILERGDSVGEYHPVGDIVELAISAQMLFSGDEEKSSRMLYSLVSEKQEIKLSTVNLENPDEEFPEVKYTLHLIEKNLREIMSSGVTAIVVYNENVDTSKFISGVMVRFSTDMTGLSQISHVGLQRGLKLLGEKEGVEYPYMQSTIDHNRGIEFSDLTWL